MARPICSPRPERGSFRSTWLSSPVLNCPRRHELKLRLPPLLCFRPPGLEAAYPLLVGISKCHISNSNVKFQGRPPSEMAVVVGFHRKTRFLHEMVGFPEILLPSRNFHFHFQRPAKKNNGETEAMEAVSGRTSRTTTVSVRQLEVQAGGPDDRQWRWRCRRRDRGEHKRRRCSRRRKGRDITMRCWW